jgi:hypothetical protein
MYYHLKTSQSDRANFDDMAERAATAMLQAITVKEALDQDPQTYAEFSWDNWFDVADHVDDLDEAKGRYISNFSQAVTDWQREKRIDQLDDELYLKTVGHLTSLTVAPGGQNDGLDFGPNLVEIVVLDHDGDTIAYRYSDDSINEIWQLGSTEDAVDALIEHREMLDRAEYEIA